MFLSPLPFIVLHSPVLWTKCTSKQLGSEMFEPNVCDARMLIIELRCLVLKSVFILLFLQVFVPLLSNQKNQHNWPRIVTEDVMKHIYELKNIVYEVRGKMNGQTLLPMPVGIERVHEVEQTIIERCMM
jgi:hypothetical protein